MPDSNLVSQLPAQVVQGLEVLRQNVAPHHFHDTSDTSLIRRPCPIDDNRQLRGDGSNLAAYLYRIKNTHPNSYQFIVRTVQQVAPWFQDFVLEPGRIESGQIQSERRHRASDSYFDGFSISLHRPNPAALNPWLAGYQPVYKKYQACSGMCATLRI